MTYTRAMHEEIQERAETFADLMARDLVDEIEGTIDRWIAEHTTLAGEEARLYHGRLRRAVLKKVAEKFLFRAHSIEEAD